MLFQEDRMQLQPGQNIALPDLTVGVSINAMPAVSGMELDCSAYLLTESGKVMSDAGMVFYGQPVAPDGSVRLDAAARRFNIDLSRVAAAVAKIAITLTIDQGLKRGQRFGLLQQVELNCECDGHPLQFVIDTRPMAETALILAELYRREGVWKLRAVGQGFVGGLGALAKHFGVDISDDPDSGHATPPPLTPSRPAAPPPSPPAPSVPPVPPPPPVRLDKITLEKRKPISLEKAGGNFGEIVVNLNWTRKSGAKGLFGLGKSSIDLDLGCMIEHTSGFKGVVQALGNTFGNLRLPPFAQLMGDDRTGDSTQGEFLKINGAEWSSIKRVLIYAFIYEGVPSWAQADARITIAVPGQPELSAHLDSHSNRHGMCAVAMLENDRGTLKATKLVEYFAGHSEMDKQYRFGFRWTAGSK